MKIEEISFRPIFSLSLSPCLIRQEEEEEEEEEGNKTDFHPPSCLLHFSLPYVLGA